MLFVGIDVGGTFTDFVFFDSSSKKPPEVVKLSTALTNIEALVKEAFHEYRDRSSRVALISHATTTATNALLTHSGLARTALITNSGFRDVLEIGRQRRPEIYNLQTQRPTPLVERKARFTVQERTLSSGAVQQSLAKNSLRKIAREIIKKRYESVAISFLNSYTNPEPERQAEKILRQCGFRGHGDISCEVDPQYREYERTSTTVVNAALAPTISRYLTRLKMSLERNGIGCPVYVMNSDGTVSTTGQVARRPISIIESGPAAGVLSSQYIAKLLSLERVITFDMGGTTAKAGIIINRIPDLSYEFEAAGRTYHGRSIKGSGYPVRRPFIDLAEVSAGGGTIARTDEAGNLQVGPESAGAMPGPAAYGQGGTQATVTDANIVAGRINPETLLGGKLRLQYSLAIKAIGKLSRELGISIDKTVEKILKTVNNNMSKALSLVTIERGRDPREHTLIAFGGAGPLHACDLADQLQIRRIIVPLHPGLFSAFGLLTSELSRTFSQPVLEPITRNMERHFKHLRMQARRALKPESFTSYKTIEQIDLRYQGQAYEITIPYRRGSNLSRVFGQKHKELYGYSSHHPVEAVNARLRAILPSPKATLAKRKLGKSQPSSVGTSRTVSLSSGRERIPIYSRELLVSGNRGHGPCVIEEYDSTTLIGKGWNWTIDAYENIDLTRAAGA